MSINICGAPCCWGVDDIKNPYLPSWTKVLEEAGQAGYKAIELGPYGYLPIDAEIVSKELAKNNLSIVAGTIFNDLLSEDNYKDVIKQTENICSLITKLPPLPKYENQHYKTPYLTIMDWGHNERDYSAGHSDSAPRLTQIQWNTMMKHIKGICQKAFEYGVRPVIHPHAGGYIEFADEIEALIKDVPYELAGLCLDTGHLYYSGMNPEEWLEKYADNLDYIHFKDINETVYQQVLKQHIRFFEGCGKGSMCPIGKGSLNYPAIKKVLEKINYHGYITIEQERDPRNSNTSLKDVKESIAYLKSIGYEI